ncbi:MAG: nucleotide exchange factor GrpE [Myxococcota bacterium]
MSGGPQKEQGKPDPDVSEGWESIAEESERSLAVNPELEAALREASEAIDEEGHVKHDEEPASEEFSGEEIERMAGQLVENRDKYVRLLADFDNFRRRAHKDREDVIRYGHENLVKDLLSTVDNLDRAIEHAQQSDDGDLASLLKGVELVQRELYAVLGKHEVQVIDAEGCPFDPTLHEAMSQVQDDSVPANSVIEVLEKGYRLRDRLLRPARVVVAKPPAEADGGVGVAKSPADTEGGETTE